VRPVPPPRLPRPLMGRGVGGGGGAWGENGAKDGCRSSSGSAQDKPSVSQGVWLVPQSIGFQMTFFRAKSVG